MPDKLRIEANERLDLGDLQHDIDVGPTWSRQLVAEFMTNPVAATKSWILSGFAMSNPAGKQLQVSRGSAILGTKVNGVVLYGALTSEGDATRIVDITSYAAGTYGIYVRFDFIDGDSGNRIFWNPAGDGSEFAQTMATRQKANWSLRIELTTPGADWMQIGTVAQASMAIVDMRNFYFEGVVNTSYPNTWGGGTDRNATRSTNGIRDLQTFTAAMRTLFEDLRPTGGRWWEKRGIKATGIAAEAGGEFIGGPTDGSYGVDGTSSATNGGGGKLTATGTAQALLALGSSAVAGAATNGTAVVGRGGSTAGLGGQFFGKAGAQGVKGVGGPTNGSIGVEGTSSATNGAGVKGTGSGTGHGVEGVAGSDSASFGVHGVATQAGGLAIKGEASGDEGVAGAFLNTDVSNNSWALVAAATAGDCNGAQVSSLGGYALDIVGDTSGTPNLAPMRIRPTATPAAGLVGDMYMTTAGVLKVCIDDSPLTWESVGAQT